MIKAHTTLMAGILNRLQFALEESAIATSSCKTENLKGGSFHLQGPFANKV